MNSRHRVSIAATSALAGATLTAVLFSRQCLDSRQKTSTGVSAESLTLNMNSTSQLRNTGATANRQITSVVNCTMR